MTSLSNYFTSKHVANFHSFWTKNLILKSVLPYKISYKTSKQSEKALTSTNHRSILEMLQGEGDGNSENENAESGDNNSLEALQEQNIEMRSESCEW